MQNRRANFCRLDLPSLGTWNSYDYMLAILLLVISLISTILGSLAYTNSETAKDTKRYPIAKMLFFASAIYTIILIILIKIRSLALSLVITIVVLLFVPGVLFLSFYFAGLLDFTNGSVFVSLNIVGVFTLVFRGLLSVLKERSSFVGPALVGNCCVGLMLLCFICPVYLILVNQDITTELLYTILKLSGTGLGILLITPWIYYHFKYFQTASQYFEKIFPTWQLPQAKKDLIEKFFFYGTSGTILSLHLACIITCISGVYNSIKSAKTDDLVIYSALLLIIPAFLYCGTSITKSQIETESKFYIFTLLCGILPLGITLPVYILIADYQYVSKYFVVLPPFAMVILAFLSMFSERETIYNTCLALLCLTVLFPIGFLYPLADSSIAPFVPLIVIICVLVSIPAALLIYFIFNALKDFFKKSKEEKLKTLKSLNFYYPTLYIIMLIFTFSEAALIFVFVNDMTEDPGSGAVIGMISFLPFVYTASSLTLQSKIDPKDSQANNSAKLKFQIISLVFCVVIVPIAIILMFALEFVGVLFVSVMKSLSIGLSLLTLLTIVMLQIKFRLPKEYSNISMISANLIIWVFFVIPVCVVFPVSLSQAADTKKTNKYIGVLIVYLGLLFMVFVSVSSAVYNAYKNKMNRDKLARKCVVLIQRILNQKRIKSTQKVIRDMYEEYAYNKYNKNFKETLKSKKHFRWDDPETQDYEFIKEIMTADAYNERRTEKDKKEKQQQFQRQEELRKKNEKEELKKKEKKYSFWLLLRCFDEYPGEMKEKAKPAFRPKEKTEGFDIEMVQEPLSGKEFDDIIPVEYDHLREPFPKSIMVQKVKENEFKNKSTLESLKIYRTERQDWLRSVFRFIANEPNDISASPWVNETIIFHFCRRGGITPELISDKDLRFIYIKSVTHNLHQIMDEDVFIDEFIRIIGIHLFKELDLISQEKKLIIDILYPNLTKNIKHILEDQDFLSAKDTPDKLQETMRRSLTLRAAGYRDGTLKRSSTVRSFINPLQSSQSLINDQTFILNSSFRTKPSQNSCFTKCFNSIGSKYTNTGSRISQKLADYLQQFYTPPKVENEDEFKEEIQKQEDENKNKDPDILQTVLKWKDFCEMFIEEVDKIVEDDNKQKEIKDIKMFQPNFSNFMAIFFKVVEILQFSALGFKKEIDWKVFTMPLSVNQTADAANSDPDENTVIIFWCIFALTILYGIIGYRSFEEIKKQKLARNDAGQRVGWRTWGFWKKKFLNIIGGGMYIFIIKYTLNIFACQYTLDTPTIPKANLECYTPWHIGLMVSALCSLLIYYPISTFLFPLMQFSDTDLDFKHNQAYLIALSQAKLLISGIKVFLPYSLYYDLQLLISSIILLLICIGTLRIQPCGDKRFNLWSSFGYFFAFSTNFFAYINVKVGGSVVVTICYFAFVGFGLFCAIGIHGLRYGFWVSAKVESERKNSINNADFTSNDRNSSMMQLVNNS